MGIDSLIDRKHCRDGIKWALSGSKVGFGWTLSGSKVSIRSL